MKRPRLAILLILAFLMSLFAPVQASWACPDGTPCVADHGHAFRCASGQCRAHASCCEVDRPTVCKHGAVPGVSSHHTAGPVIDAPDHCRFTVSAASHPVAGTADAASLLTLSPAALPVYAAPVVPVPPAAPAWLAEYSLGYRPPPLLSSGPSRAPPSV